MNNRIWRNSIVGIVAAFTVAISVDHGVAQKKSDAQKEVDKAEEKKAEPKPVKPLESPCGGKLVAMHAYSECGPDKVWHVVEDDYYDCPPVQKFRVYDHATEQPCDKPPPDPIKDGFQQFNGSGCQDFKDIGPMDIYECDEKTGLWYLNTYEVYVCSDGRRLVTLKDRKETGKSCKDPKPELKLPVVALNQPASTNAPPNDTIGSLIHENKIRANITGTGETIGHVADVTIQNLTDQPLNVSIQPMILESGSGKNQHYACPKGKTVALKPHGSATVPMDGVCVNRSKPPVGKGVSGDLLVNEGNPNIAQDPKSHLKAKDADKLLRIATSKYDAADKLQKDGALKDLPYHDKQKQKDIVVQWSTWTDPQISEITGAPPATKEDLRKVVYKQVEEQGPVTPEKKKKIDKGIDTIFDKIELTTEKAKDLEKPDPFAHVELTGEEGKGENKPPPINVSDNTPTPSSAVPPTVEATPTPSDEKPKPATQEKAPGEPAAQANSDDDCRKRLKQLIEAAQQVARLGQIWAAIQAEWNRWDDIVLSCDLKLEKARSEANSLHAAVEGGDHPEEVDNYQQALDRLQEAERERERAVQKRSDVADTAVAAHRAFLAAVESYEKLRIAYERDCHERAPAPPKIPAVRAQPPPPGRAMVEMNLSKGLTADEFKTRTRKTIKGWRELAKGAKDPADARHYNAEADRLGKMVEEMR